MTSGAHRWQTIVVRGALAGAVSYACLGPPGAGLLRELVPLQRSVLAAALPDFSLIQFGLQQRNAHFTLHASSVNVRHLVVRGRVHPPGFVFEVETPARTALLHAALILGGTVLTADLSGRGRLVAAAVAVAATALMTVVTPPLVLAGQQWSLGLEAWEELSLPALWVGLSDFILRGGGYALCAAAVALVAAAARGFSAAP
jgi:hypothetical protein